MRSRLSALLLMPLLLLAQDPLERDRKQIVAAYQRTIDALNRGDADAALELETPDWVSITVGQKPVTRQEMEPLIRRNIASMKQPPDWAVVWKPDYEHNGTSTGIQIYDLKVSGDQAVVLYLVGSTQTETRNGETHRVWHGSHIRDTLIRTSAGWKRRMHEKTHGKRTDGGRTDGSNTTKVGTSSNPIWSLGIWLPFVGGYRTFLTDSRLEEFNILAQVDQFPAKAKRAARISALPSAYAV